MDTKKWLYVRLALVAPNAIFLAIGPSQETRFPWEVVLPWFGIMVIALPLYLGTLIHALRNERYRGYIAERWTKPSWYANPFDLTQPAQAVHLLSFIMIISGAAQLVSASGPLLSPSLGIVMLGQGIALFIGVWLSVLIFRHRFTPSPDLASRKNSSQ